VTSDNSAVVVCTALVLSKLSADLTTRGTELLGKGVEVVGSGWFVLVSSWYCVCRIVVERGSDDVIIGVVTQADIDVVIPVQNVAISRTIVALDKRKTHSFFISLY